MSFRTLRGWWAVGADAQGQPRAGHRGGRPYTAATLQERRPPPGRVPNPDDRALRHADAVVRRLARARPGVGPRVLRPLAERLSRAPSADSGPMIRTGSRREARMGGASRVVILGVLGGSGVVWADEAPISGTVKSVDADANTITLEATARGKTRQVTVYLKPGAKVVRFTRGTEPGKTGFLEQAIVLTDLKPGWIVSVETKHEGDKEVADVVKVVLQR